MNFSDDQQLQQQIYNCKYNGKGCTLDIKRVLNKAEKQMPLGYHVDISTLHTDMADYIPSNIQYGFYGADGVYYNKN